MTRLQRRYLSSSSSGVQVQKSTDTPIIGNLPPIVDFRSDTVTAPTKEMLDCVQHAITGDDVMGEDPTVLELESFAAALFEKEQGLYFPTGTMANLVAVMSHSHGTASEIIVGTNSHLCLYEGGGVSTLGGIHSRQIQENVDTAEFNLDEVQDYIRDTSDDHYPETKVICLENTHNMMGGIPLSSDYVNQVGALARRNKLKVHIDGARIFHASIAQKTSVAELSKGADSVSICLSKGLGAPLGTVLVGDAEFIRLAKRGAEGADSVSICLSKGLGAPLGTVLVGDAEFIRLAKRARKRCGGGMRQSGVVACMGLHALLNNVNRLEEDHRRAKHMAEQLFDKGFILPRNGKVETNMFFFGIPKESNVTKEDLTKRMWSEYGVMVGGGYSKGGEMFRLVTHMNIDDEGMNRCLRGLVTICKP
eukprot:CAMPEP_0194446366 /NCGR_PEP_ID=MMETSP0176-20130528/128394_1 /TAXON_ID=216777 /ORGANISM="Proboscia alata, Strain PI-D3" /LENGTH=419 /DNA_ID=CAMNT_0039273067 /DNA_START=50 /DNA_END=1308 /DNA_ORIENTATION=+